MNITLIICLTLGGLILAWPLVKGLFSRPADCDLECMIRAYLNDLDVEEGLRQALKGQLAMVLAHHSRNKVEGLIEHDESQP